MKIRSIIIVMILLVPFTSEAFRRMPPGSNPNILCYPCQRVDGASPVMSIYADLDTFNQTEIGVIGETAAIWNTSGNSNFKFNVSTTSGGTLTSNDQKSTILKSDYNGLCQDGVQGASFPKLSALICDPGVDPEGNCYYKILEADLVLCDNINWYVGNAEGISGGGDQSDLMTILLHELGHHLGLGHANTNGNPDASGECGGIADTGAVMDTCVYAGYVRRDLLNSVAGSYIQQGDLQGIQHIYGVYEPDIDGDGVIDKVDNCPNVANHAQADMDGDGKGDTCEDDIDGDGLSTIEEGVIGSSDLKTDTDADGLGDYEEVKVYGTNPILVDTDADGVNDLKEIEVGTDPLKKDNPAVIAIITAYLLDDDADSDGIDDDKDNCINKYNPGQEDEDEDGLGDVCDPFNMTWADMKILSNAVSWTLNNSQFTKKQMCTIMWVALNEWPEWCKEE